MRKIYLTALALSIMTGAMAQKPLISSSEQAAIMKIAPSMVLSTAPSTKSPIVSKANTLAENEMYVSYCQEALPLLRLGTEKPYEMASYFDNMLIDKYVGDKITKLRVHVGGKPAALTVWLREKLGEEPIFSKEIPDADLPNNGWIEVELPADKVYTIKKSGYYVGYTITEKKVSSGDNQYYPISTSRDGSLLNNTLLISQDGWQSWTDLTSAYASNEIIAVLAVQTAIASDKHVNYDLALSNFHGDFSFIKRDAEKNKATLAYNGYVFNAGKEPITGFDLTVSADGAEPIVSSMEIDGELTMFKGAPMRGSIDVPYNTSSIKINLKASNINKGKNVDGYAGNDEINTEDIYFYEIDTVKTSLVELYTTDRCGNCPLGHKVIEALPKDCNKVLVAHHVGFQEDIYTMQESYNYMYEFGVTGAPSATTDRTYLLDEFSTAFVTGYRNPQQGATVVNDYITFSQGVLPAFASIGISSAYDKESRELTVRVTGRKVNSEMFDKAIKQPRVNVYLTEDGIIGTQSGSTGKYTHNHVLRSILGGIWGTDVTWNGDVYTVEFKTTVSTKWKTENMNIVAVLTNEDSESRNYHYAMNAAQTDLEGNLSSIENNTVADLLIEAVNGTIQVMGDYDVLRVFNMQGVQVENSNLGKGIYIVKVQTGNRAVVNKISVD